MESSKRGGIRKGAGRKPETGTPMERKNVTLDADTIAVMKAVGDGDLSKGIRFAAKFLKQHYLGQSMIVAIEKQKGEGSS